MLLNRFNFIVWSSQPPEPADLSGLPVGGNIGRVSAVVVFIPGEGLQFFVNAPDGFDTTSTVISLVADNAALTVVQIQVGYLQQVNVAGLSKPQYFARVSAPGGLKQEYYRFKVGPYYSNRILYKPTSEGVNDMSAIFSFRSARNLAYIPYELPELAAFRQIMRIKCFAGNPQNDTTVEKYNAVSTGRVRTTNIQQNLYRPFSVPDADVFAHEGFTTMLNHKDLLVNGRPFSLKTGYQTGTDSAQLATGTFELWETDFALVTRC